MTEAKKKTLPNTKANRPEIVDLIEAKKGPVGPGHHNSHRTEHIMAWLKKKAAQ